ncbi:MAG: tetratricopeptide repeat protein, partial [Candidatus Omnitrophica bacterium]|nr:tetratricopeptide repeat protein [Candidatus Omnitrophota bacterium]
MKKFFILVFVVALSINSSSDAASESLEQAKIFYNQARFQDAIAAYKKAIEDNGRDTELYLNLAYLYKDLLEYGKAIQVLENIPEALKGLRQAKLLGRLYYLCAKHKQAILLLEQWLSRNPDDIELLFYLASTYEDIADLARAEEYYLKITKLQAKHVLAHLKLAGIYYQMKAYQRSAEFYQKVIELDPSITDSRIKLADCFRESGKFEEAYKQYAKCIAINPDDKSLEGKLKAVKAELGEDFLKERKESISRLRRKKLPRITSSLYAAGALPLRVGIGKIEKLVEFKCAGDFSFINKENNALLFKGKAELIYSLIFHKNKVSIQLRDSQGKTLLENLIKPFYIKNASENQLIAIFDIPAGSGNFWAGRSDNQYRGMIEIMPEDDGFWLINLINLEEYLYSVLPSEMPAAWP